MSILLVPYHQDERLAGASFPLAPGRAVTTVAPELPQGELWPRLRALYTAVADAVERDIHARADDSRRATPMPIVVSGDCLVSLGIVAGVQRTGADPAIVWFDAHGDMHALHTSTSGYLGGMALRFVLGGHPELAAHHLGLRAIPEERATLVDARDLDPAERDYLATGRVRRCQVDEIRPDILPDGPLVIHFDVDVIDPEELPGLRFPAPHGPSASTVLAAVRRIRDTGRVVAMHVSCPWYVPMGSQNDVRARLLEEAIGG
ncbi:arginase family protein [Pendulispora albinea]|uniref:Arginase family protein n=1 Tax=Pendulispora albinea TaxID=2741071 RepID=A0ABZ2LUU6_9BACT